MRKVILDTDLFSECIKGKNVAVKVNYSTYIEVHERLTITSWTAFEVLSGFYHRLPTKAPFYEQLIAETDEILPSRSDYRRAAMINGALLQAGKPVGDTDPLIAACAITRGLPIATGNSRHYQTISDLGFELELENWRDN